MALIGTIANKLISMLDAQYSGIDPFLCICRDPFTGKIIWRVIDKDFSVINFFGASKAMRKNGENTGMINIHKVNKEEFIVYYDKYRLALGRNFTKKLVNELPVWKKFYTPPFSLKDKTVLDVGAGQGETAAFFYSLGAKRVVAIEPNQFHLRYLRTNKLMNDWNMRIIDRTFELNDVDSEFFAWKKFDCEGGEGLLLGYNNDLGPTVIEAKDEYVVPLVKKFGFHTTKLLGNDVMLS